MLVEFLENDIYRPIAIAIEPSYPRLGSDDVQSPADERLRELNFCLYGKLNNFCGNAKVLRLKNGSKADASAAVKAFIQGIELQAAPSK